MTFNSNDSLFSTISCFYNLVHLQVELFQSILPFVLLKILPCLDSINRWHKIASLVLVVPPMHQRSNDWFFSIYGLFFIIIQNCLRFEELDFRARSQLSRDVVGSLHPPHIVFIVLSCAQFPRFRHLSCHVVQEIVQFRVCILKFSLFLSQYFLLFH